MSDIVERAALLDEIGQHCEAMTMLFDEIERLRALNDGNGQRAQSYFEELERLRRDMRHIEAIANIAPADDRCGSLAVRMNKVWLTARGQSGPPQSNVPPTDVRELVATIDEQPTSAQVPGGPTCHPGAFWEASSPTTGVSIAVCSICKQPAKT